MVVCCYRQDVIVLVGLDVEWAIYIESTCCMISYSVRSCVVHVKYCNHLLAVDMAGVACRGLWFVCDRKNVKRYRDGSP